MKGISQRLVVRQEGGSMEFVKPAASGFSRRKRLVRMLAGQLQVNDLLQSQDWMALSAWYRWKFGLRSSASWQVVCPGGEVEDR